jgi:hypothetical protein
VADLIDRIAGTDDTRPKLNLHRFIGVERLYAFGEWTRGEVAAEFDLQGDELVQAGQLADEIDDKLNNADKALYILRVESICMCLEDGDDRLYHNPDGTVNRAKVYEDLLITG